MNVTFKTIVINNFLSLGEGININLNDQGFVLVKGVNKESNKTQSNGSGKSSIFDAIFWTITGETLRGASEVVNEKSKSGCSCELEFDIDQSSYKIVRYKSHPEYGNSCYFYEDNVLLTDQSKKSQEMIFKVIPTMSPEILGSIVLLGQGLPYRFSSMSPSRRKDLLDTMSGSSSKIDKLKYQLDIEESQYVKQYNDLSTSLIRYDAEISSNEKLVEVLTNQKNYDSEEIKRKIDDLKSDSATKEHQVSVLTNSRLPEINEKLTQINSLVENVRSFMTKTESEINFYQNSLNQVSEGSCPTCGRPYDDLTQRLQKANQDRQMISARQDTLNILRAKYEGLKSQLVSVNEEFNSINNTVTALRYSVDSNNKEIERLSEEAVNSSKISEKINESQKLIKELKVSEYDCKEKIEEEKGYIDSIAYLKRQISRDFKGYVLEESIKFLSSRSKMYGNYLFKDKLVHVELSGNKILIALDGRLYENLSGGERQRVDLSVQFALRDLLMITSGFSCNILVLDEAFDNLDSQGSDSLNNLVVSEFSDINSVFTVTHHTDISIPYDKTLLVTKNQEGVSEVEEV